MKAVLILSLLATFCFAKEIRDENLLMSIPKEFKIGYKAYDPKTNLSFAELVPQSENVNNWSQMLTVSIFYNNLPVSAKEYADKIKEMWSRSCEGSHTEDIANGKENGYDFALIMLFCPKSGVTNKEEFTWIKAIKGNDGFYTVQKSFTIAPSKEQITDSMSYMKNVQVCDMRLKNCPMVR